MPPATIVPGVRRIMQRQFSQQVPKKWRKLFTFGMQAYALRSFQSATGNARMVVANPNTAARKSERLLANYRLANHMGTVLDTLGIVRESSFVNIDHSDMHELLALVGAVQTGKGRAIPCMVEATYASTIPHHNSRAATPRLNQLRSDMLASRQIQSFSGHIIDSLQAFHDRLGFWPRLVFDRGFGSAALIDHLDAEGATFYIRLKAQRNAMLGDEKLAVQQLPEDDASVIVAGRQLRVIRSPQSRRSREPWYILTNDFTSTRMKVVSVYYHRFEIEETFRDIKHIWDLHRTRLSRPNSMKVILWFVALGIAMLYVLMKPRMFVAMQSNPKKKCSWLREAFEQLQREVTWMRSG